MMSFLTADNDVTTYTNKTFFHDHSQAIRELAEGKELWGENTSQGIFFATMLSFIGYQLLQILS